MTNNIQLKKWLYIGFITTVSMLGIAFDTEVRNHPEIIHNLLRNHNFIQALKGFGIIFGFAMLGLMLIMIIRGWRDLSLLQSQEPLKRDTLYSMISRFYVNRVDIDEKR